MTTRKREELPPAYFPTAQDKVKLFREHGIEAVELPRGNFIMPDADLVVEIKGGMDEMKRAIAVAVEHGLTVMSWVAAQRYSNYLVDEHPECMLYFSFWEGTSRERLRYGGTYSDLLSR